MTREEIIKVAEVLKRIHNNSKEDFKIISDKIRELEKE